MKLVQITTDGGAVMQFGAGFNGIYTSQVQTCCVYAFYSTTAMFVVHDTGQLSISSICSIAKKIGKIKNIICARNDACGRKFQIDSHNERRKKIKSILGYKKPIEKIQTSYGGDIVFYEKHNFSTPVESIELENIVHLPELEKRHAINECNNIFSPKNSQSLPIDIQFESMAYTEIPNLLLKKESMLLRAQRELEVGDRDYMDFYNRLL